MDRDTFLGVVKSECNKRGFNYCRAAESLAFGMYCEGYMVSEVMTQLEMSANIMTNFTLGVK